MSAHPIKEGNRNLARIPETDLRISVAQLREVLEKFVADGDIEPIHVNVDEIINRVKEEI